MAIRPAGPMKNVYRAAAILVGVVLGMYLFIRFVAPYLAPFIVAAVISFLIDPAVNFLERRARMPRGLAVFLILGLVVIVVGFFVVIGIAQIQTELSKLRQSLPQYSAWLTRELQSIVDELGESFSTLPAPVTEFIGSNTRQLANKAMEVVNSAVAFVAEIPNLLTVLIVSILATYFISKDKTKVTTFLFEFLPERQRMSARRMEYQIMGAVVRLIRAQLLIMTIMALMTIIGLSILRVDYAWLIGLFVGVLDMLPMIGVATFLLPWGLYSIFVGRVGFGLGLLILLGIELLVRQIVETKIVGKSIGVHPLATLLSLYVGYRLFGFAGFFIGPVLAVVIRAIVVEAILPMLPHKRQL
ncbi:MAG: sporulation integral membrane protein YtvI [Bacillota bacterium]|nr:sporulation integral membrane protein YtvI [Bacillota bacterium]HPZ53925.1 sporulation integral membrane protein YtvI [Bacillota bacterium]HQD18135.1 sporulation integral membrane protein YtvI [Bacillota bacterium]